MLRLEQRLGEPGIRLPQRHHVAPGREALAAERDRMERGANLDLPAMQNAEQRGEPDGILVLSRQNVGIGPPLPPADCPAFDRQEVLEPVVAVAGSVLEQGVGAVGLVRHDVTQRPMTARPGIAEVPGPLVRVEASAARRQLVEGQVDRRREVRARRLRQDADAAMVVLVGPGGRPRVVHCVDHDPRLALPRERPRHSGAQGVHTVDQQGIDVRLDGIEVGRQEEPRSVGVLLVNVVHDLRVPHVVDRVHDELRLHLGEGVPVAVVVVPGVMMVQLGGIGAFGWGAEGTVVPAGDDRDAIGVERRDQPEDHVVEYGPGRQAGVAREPVREHRGRQVPADLSRVDAGRDEHDGLAKTEHVLRFLRGLEATGIREPRVELTVTVQGPQVLWARDGECNERGAERAVPQLAVVHAIARRGQCLVVPHEGRPIGELPVFAGLESQHRPRGRNAWGGDRGRAASWGRTAWLLRCGKGSRRGGDRHGEQEHQRAEHGGRRTYRRPARRRYGSLCSSTRRFCARPAAVLLGAM